MKITGYIEMGPFWMSFDEVVHRVRICGRNFGGIEIDEVICECFWVKLTGDIGMGPSMMSFDEFLHQIGICDRIVEGIEFDCNF